MSKEYESLLVQIAQMYYLDDKTQGQIATELQIHRSTISRLLKQCREKGVVQIAINPAYNQSPTLESELMERFQLKKVVIVPTTDSLNEEARLTLLGQATARYLEQILTADSKVGISWGAALSAVVNALGTNDKEGAFFVPMVGGPAAIVRSDYHVNTIVYQAASKMNGRSYLIDAPTIVQSKKVRDELLASNNMKAIIDIWDHLDVALFGIGSPNIKNTERWKSFYGQNIFRHLDEKMVAGDIVSRCYDFSGHHIDSKLDDLIVGITLQQLYQVPLRIAVAESAEKVDAILAALLGHIPNVLITNDLTARMILDKVSSL